ncbi:folylpolyglutamate synthase [Favolaschia claudopus]|uniref:Folylpolyglutamate synthase n=1 Tax=Favolaschia claudopus TaxID=2862362 RepID=A0AAW0EEL9_9AGAR
MRRSIFSFSRFFRGARTMSTRSYRDAVDSLNSLQSNAAALEQVRASGGRSSAFAIPEMLEYLGIIGYKPTDLNALNVIHITGTKGKGSTSAFTDSILRESHPEWTTGLYTSPHLVAVRERIRINGKPLSEEAFTKYFFEVWDRINENKTRVETTPDKPGYFRFMTLVAYHTFLSLKVDVTILEVGVGGTYDSTNIVPKPVVTGVTSLGIDHITVLGHTLKEIAWHKGGIFKEGVPAFTVDQPTEGLEVLEQQAKDLKASEFNVVPSIPELSTVKLGLAGMHQLTNASLAVHLARAFLSSKSSPLPSEEVLTEDFVRGLRNARWPGRCQTVHDPTFSNTTWYMDGAHTLESIGCCMQWFVSPGIGLEADASKKNNRILIFNCTNGRSGSTFLGTIDTHITSRLKLFNSSEVPSTFFDHVIFCTNVTYVDGGFKADITTVAMDPADLAQLKTQNQLASAWSSLIPSFPAANIHVLPSVEHAVNLVRKLESVAGSANILVAGSLHLVGGVFEVAELSSAL